MCQVVTQTETRSQFAPMIGVFYLLKVPKDIRFLMESENNTIQKYNIFIYRYKLMNELNPSN